MAKKKKKKLELTQMFKTRAQVKEIVVLQMVARTALPRMFVTNVKYYNNNFSC